MEKAAEMFELYLILFGQHDSSLAKESLMLEGTKQVGQHLGLQNDEEYANSDLSVVLGLTD